MSKFYIKSISEVSIFTLDNELIMSQKYDPPIMLNKDDTYLTDHILKEGIGGIGQINLHEEFKLGGSYIIK